MWFPGYERPYFQRIDQRVGFALGRNISTNALPETAIHTGFQALTTDLITDSLLIRPYLQNYAVPNPVYADYIVKKPPEPKKKVG